MEVSKISEITYSYKIAEYSGKSDTCYYKITQISVKLVSCSKIAVACKFF